MKSVKLNAMLTAIMSLWSCASLPTKATIINLDIPRYMGKWYEIARFDHSFERRLTGVTATYSLTDNGYIKVINAGYKDSLCGKLSQAVGKAKQPNERYPGYLKVSFFLWFYADYLILYLDNDYQYALIGSDSDKYLWILSRTPKIDDSVKERLLQKARDLNYNVDNLIWVQQ